MLAIAADGHTFGVTHCAQHGGYELCSRTHIREIPVLQINNSVANVVIRCETIPVLNLELQQSWAWQCNLKLECLPEIRVQCALVVIISIPLLVLLLAGQCRKHVRIGAAIAIHCPQTSTFKHVHIENGIA